jgi:hypothetical protein
LCKQTFGEMMIPARLAALRTDAARGGASRKLKALVDRDGARNRTIIVGARGIE